MFHPTSFRFFSQRLVLVTCSLVAGATGTLLAMDGAPQASRRPVKPGTTWMSGAGVSGHVILTPEDTYLALDGANNSRSEMLATYTWPDHAVGNAIVMKFDLSGVPASATVTGAALHMALIDADATPEATYAVSAHRILQRNLKVLPFTPGDISAPLDRAVIDKAPGFKSWTVTSIVRQWMADPSSNLGLLLNSDVSRKQDRYRIFASADHSTISLRPYLAIAYRVPGNTDVTRPEVTLTSPDRGTTVSGAVPITAAASDDTGVAGVRFLVENQGIGDEDTTAPYDVVWDTSSVAAGTYSVTAIARDAAGNTRASAAVSVTVTQPATFGGGVPPSPPPPPGPPGPPLPPPPAPGRGVVFSSNWNTATGFGAAAVSDGGRWPNVWEFNRGTGVQLMSVVPGGPNGNNALQVQQRGSTFAANLQIDNALPQSTDFFMRYYMRNDDTSGEGDHIVTADTFKYSNLTYMRKMGGPDGWRFVMSLFGCGYTYPIGHWGPSGKLQNGAWYRFEYFVHYVDATHLQVYPRVYDANGALILSEAEFRQSDFGGANWNGRSDWTLASYYAAGHSFCVDPEFTNDFGIGNNGQQGAADTGGYWYFAGFEIRTDGWPGAMGSTGMLSSPILDSSDGSSIGAGDEPDDVPTGIGHWPGRVWIRGVGRQSSGAGAPGADGRLAVRPAAMAQSRPSQYVGPRVRHRSR